ncbi:MAG TPA: tetratricopeptide repeat protein [Pyrinomonadaceae bacterium]
MSGPPVTSPAVRRASRRLMTVVVAVSLVALAAYPLIALAQDRPKIADEVEGVEKPKGGAAKENGRTKGEGRRSRAPRTSAGRQPATLGVVFITGVAEADVSVLRNDTRLDSLGLTGADGRLLTRLPQGDYDVVVTRDGYYPRRQPVEVRPGNTTYTFNLAKAPAPTDVTPPPTAAEIIRRYLDPKQTDNLKPADWQVAQAQAAALYAQNSVEPQLEAQALFTQGQVAFLRGDYRGAVSSFNHAALVMPNSALAYYGLGNAYFAGGYVNEAKRSYQRAIELNGELALPYKGMGDTLLRLGKSEEALGFFERARALGYDSTETRLGVARALLKLRRWQQGLSEFLELSRTAPTAEVFLGLGDCYANLGQAHSAAPAYRKAVELEPHSALAHYKRGALAYELHEYAEAAKALERALALAPTGSVIDRSRAREMLRKARRKN